MNRRGFFQRLVGLFGVAVAAPLAREPAFGWQEYSVPLTYRGIPYRFDKYAPASTVYFINPKTLYFTVPETMELMCDNPRSLGVITGIQA